jgi:hypothetical protein
VSINFKKYTKLGYENISICLVHIKTDRYIRVAENANTNIRTNGSINRPSSNIQEKYMIKTYCLLEKSLDMLPYTALGIAKLAIRPPIS